MAAVAKPTLRSPHAVRQLVAIATAGAGVRVVFTGNEAMTDGKVIYLPSMVAPEVMDMMVGYAWHESFHILYTDFDVVESYEDKSSKWPILHELVNAVEDGRIEVKGKREYPGTAWKINNLITALKRKGDTLFNAPSKGAGPANLLLGYVLNWARANVNQYDSITHLGDWRSALATTIGSDLVDEIDQVLDQTYQLPSTAAVYDSCIEILELVKDKVKDDQGGQGKKKPKSGQSGGQGKKGSSSGQSQPQKDDSKSGDKKDLSSGDEKPDGDGKSGSKGDAGSGDKRKSSGQGGSGDAKGQKKPDDSGGSGAASRSEKSEGAKDGKDGKRAKARKDILNADPKDLAKTDLGDVASKAINEAQEKVSKFNPRGGSGGNFQISLDQGRPCEQAYSEVAAPAAALGARLRGILQAETLVKDRALRRSGKKLDRRKLVRVALDDDRIWKRPSIQVDTSGHVHLILDTSRSMLSQVSTLKSAGLATVRAVESVEDLSCSAVTLPLRNGIHILKTKTEAATSVASRFSELTAVGGTPLAQTIEATETFLMEDVGNRLLVVFTDGCPDNANAVKAKVLELKERFGVMACAIILGNDPNPLEKMMPCARLERLDMLPVVVTNMIASLIREKLRGGRQ